jgi:hypothetical protein
VSKKRSGNEKCKQNVGLSQLEDVDLHYVTDAATDAP